MELAEQFKEYALDKDSNVLAWFHALTQKEQKSLKKDILAIHEQLSENKFRHQMLSKAGMTSYTQVRLCCMYVFSLNQYCQNLGGIPDAYWKQQYYKTFRPSWINQLIADTWDMQYPMLCELLGYDDVTLEPAVIVEKIINTFTFNSWNNDDKRTHQQVYDTYFKGQSLFLEHIWLFFSEPADMAYGDSDGYITDTFIQLVLEKKIDRQSVLSECLLTAGRNFNKNNAGWFFKLFSALAPTLSELKELEPSLLLALNCPFSKAQNEALKHLKTLAKEGQIDPTTFLEASPSTLSSAVKSVVTATTAIIELIGKQANKDKSIQNESLLQTCCDTLCQGFILKDEKIQTRIAKFIVRYGDTSDTPLCDNISSYSPELFSSVQTLLADFLTADAVADNQMDDMPLSVAERIREDNVITLPQTFDDKIYFLNQAFDNNEPYHFDVYLNVIVSLYNELTAENVHRLLPVIQKLNKNGVDWQTSRAEQAMGLQFIYFISRLLKCFHGSDFYHQIQKDIKLNEGYFKFELAGNVDSIDFFTAVKKLESFSKKTYTSERNRYFLKPLYLGLVQYVDAQLDKPKDEQLPMLSLPTHVPCFIEFNCFIERLINHLAHDATLKATNTFDFQLALSRVVYSTIDAHQFFKSAQFLKIQEKNKEIASLLHYLIEENSLSVNNCKTLPLWLTTAYVKQQNNDFQNLITHYQKDLAHLQLSVDWQVQGGSEWKEIKYALTPSVRNELKYKKIDTFQQYIVEMISPYIESYQIAIYEKLFCLTPNNMHLAYVCIVCGIFGYEHLKEKFANTILNLQFELWQKQATDAGYIYFAMMLLHNKNTVKQLAGELWLKTIQEQNVDTVCLGVFMGKLLHDDFAPLKRFTDLLTQQLINVSNTHNHALITLISNMLPNMNDTPIKGTKKLLELYLELLTVMKTQLTDLKNAEKIQEKLAVWAETKSLKTVIKKLN